jgi:hypothetical protein
MTRRDKQCGGKSRSKHPYPFPLAAYPTNRSPAFVERPASQSSMHYNFVRIHQSLRITPAMAAGVTAKLWSMTDMVRVIVPS